MSENCEQEYIDFEPDVLTVQKIRKAVKWLNAQSVKPIEYAAIFMTPELEEYLKDLDNSEPIDILKVGHKAFTPGKEPNANSQDATSDSDLGGPSAALMGGSLSTADARPNFRIPYVC